MKKKYLYSLLTTYMATLGTISSCGTSQPSAESAPEQPKKVYVYKPRELKTRVDTLDITDENFEHVRKTAISGKFLVRTNTVVLNYFKPMSDSSCVIRFCELNNSMHPLFLRHETEHARKQDLVYNTGAFSDFACGEISVADEVSARVAEIIEAVDYHASTGNCPPCKAFIRRADSVIRSTPGAFMSGRINYNYQPVADAVLTYALEGFLNAYNRGFYGALIRQAYNRKNYKKTQCLINPYTFSFNPDLNQWDAMWDFESCAGHCNPYRYATYHTRQKLMHAIDSVVCDATGAGKIALFYKNDIFR